jgi:oligosaccharide 4-alpha-D-glucosyltransferase
MRLKYLFLTFIFPFLSNKISAQTVGNFVKYEKNNADLLVQGTSGSLLIQAFSSDIFKVQTLSPNQARFDSSTCVSMKPAGRIGQITENTQKLIIPFEKCTLEVNKNPLRVSLKVGNQTKIEEFEGFSQTKDYANYSFTINYKDVMHGAGSRPYDIDLNGKVFDFYNKWRFGYYDDIYGQTFGLNQSLNVPFIISSHKYGIFFDSDMPGQMRMSLGGFDSTKLNVETLSQGRWAYYLINGESNDEILSNYTLLTGRQPLPPRWALGYIQSKFGYEKENDAKTVVDELRKGGFPIDAIVLDLFWYGGFSRMGDFDWYKPNWQNPTQMVDDFNKKGVKTILITDPYITTKSFNFKLADSVERFLATRPNSTQSYIYNHFGNLSGLIDIFHPKAQSFIWKNYKRLVNQGVGGWWTDKIEPDNHPDDAVHVTGNAIQVHNLYSLVWHKTLFENFRKDFPTQRLFNLTRSGYAGSQRFGALPWSGDVARVWSGLKLQIPIMIQSGMTGFGYMHSDTGGFWTPVENTEKDEELDIRWLQFSVFSPIVRPHGERISTEPYNLSKPASDIYKNYLNIRYKLLPYLYTLSWQNSTIGRPICMPMDYFEFSKENGNISDQYFFGENLIVSPVLLHGMPVRRTILPKGKWFSFWTNEVFEGNGKVFENLTLDHIPVYAKAGGIVPMASSAKVSTEYYTSDSLTIKFFQDISVPSSRFTMYHDDGKDPETLQNKRFELIDFIGKSWLDSLQLETIRKSSYLNSLENRALLVEIPNIRTYPSLVKINNKTIKLVLKEEDFKGTDIAYYNFKEKLLKVRHTWNCATPNKLIVYRKDGILPLATEPIISPQENLLIFPNPTESQNTVTIQTLITEAGSYQIQIFDNSGKNIHQDEIGKIEKGENLSYRFSPKGISGTFIVKIQNEKGSFLTGKMLVK